MDPPPATDLISNHEDSGENLPRVLSHSRLRSQPGAPGAPPEGLSLTESPPGPPPGPPPEWAETLESLDADGEYDPIELQGDNLGTSPAVSQSIAPEAPEPKQGWLWKANPFGKNFKKRWVVLSDGHFRYRKREDRKAEWIKEPEYLKEAELNPGGMGGSSGFPHKTKTKYAFRVKIPGRMYFFCAESGTDEDAWLQAFRKHINFAQVPTASRQAPLPPPTEAEPALSKSQKPSSFNGPLSKKSKKSRRKSVVKTSELSGKIMAKVPKSPDKGGGFHRKQFEAHQMEEAQAWITQKEAQLGIHGSNDGDSKIVDRDFEPEPTSPMPPPVSSKNHEDDMLTFFLVMTESHKDTERQFEMTMAEDDADNATILEIKKNISQMLTPEGEPEIDVNRIELTMSGHPCRDDFKGIEIGLSEGTIFECHLRDDVGYGAPNLASLTEGPAGFSELSGQDQNQIVSSSPHLPLIPTNSGDTVFSETTKENDISSSVGLTPFEHHLDEVLEIQIVIGNTPAPTLLRIDPRHETPEEAARTFCQEHGLNSPRVASLVTEQVCQLLKSVEGTAGREASMLREISILHEQLSFGHPLTKKQIDSQRIRYENEINTLRKKLDNAEKRAIDSEQRCKEALKELESLRRNQSQSSTSMLPAPPKKEETPVTISSHKAEKKIRRKSMLGRRKSVKARSRRKSVKKTFGQTVIGDKPVFMPPADSVTSKNMHVSAPTSAPTHELDTSTRAIEMDNAVKSAEMEALKKKVALLESRLETDQSSMEKHSNAQLLRKLSVEMERTAEIPLLQTELKRAKAKLKEVQETEMVALKDELQKAKATISDLEHNSKPAPTDEQEHAWSEAARKASELVRATAAEAEAARQETKAAIEKCAHAETMAKERDEAQNEVIAKLKSEVFDMHKEIEYLHEHLRHKKKDLKHDKTIIKDAKALATARSLKNLVLKTKNEKSKQSLEEMQEEHDRKVKSLLDNVEHLNAQRNSDKAKMDEMSAQLQSEKSKLKSATEQLDSQRAKVDEIQSKLEDANAKLGRVSIPSSPIVEPSSAAGAPLPPSASSSTAPTGTKKNDSEWTSAKIAEHRKLKMRLILLRVAHEMKVSRMRADVQVCHSEIKILKSRLADVVLKERRGSSSSSSPDGGSTNKDGEKLRQSIHKKDEEIKTLKKRLQDKEESKDDTDKLRGKILELEKRLADSDLTSTNTVVPKSENRDDIWTMTKPDLKDSGEVMMLKQKLRDVSNRLKASRLIQGDEVQMQQKDDSFLSRNNSIGIRVGDRVARSEWRKFADEKRALMAKYNSDRQKLVDEIRRLRDMIDPKQRPESKMEIANAEIAKLQAELNSERMKRQASDAQVQQMALHLRNLGSAGTPTQYGSAAVAAAKSAGAFAIEEQLHRANAEILRLRQEQNLRPYNDSSNWQIEKENLMRNWNEVRFHSKPSSLVEKNLGIMRRITFCIISIIACACLMLTQKISV